MSDDGVHSEGHSVHIGNTSDGIGRLWQKVKASRPLQVGIVLLLVAILPVVVLLAREQQTNRSSAAKATVLSFTPRSTERNPIGIKRGNFTTLNIMLDPGTNLVNVVQLEIQYNPDHLGIDDPAEAIKIDANVLPQELEKPHIEKPGTIRASYAIGSDPSKAISTPTQIGTITFRGKKPTDGKRDVLVRFGNETTVLSLAESDSPDENVLSNTNAAHINVNKPAPNSASIEGAYVVKSEEIIIPDDVSINIRHVDNRRRVRSTSDMPSFEFYDIDHGRWDVAVRNIPGYTFTIAECQNTCEGEQLTYSSQPQRRVQVGPNRTKHIRVMVDVVPPTPTPTPTNTPTPTPTPTPTVTLTPTPVPACNPTAADVNKDGKNDDQDTLKVVECMNLSTSTNPSCAAADIYKTGRITIRDYNCVSRGGK